MGLVKAGLCIVFVVAVNLAVVLASALIFDRDPFMRTPPGLVLWSTFAGIYLMFFFRRPWPYDEKCPFRKFTPEEQEWRRGYRR